MAHHIRNVVPHDQHLGNAVLHAVNSGMRKCSPLGVLQGLVSARVVCGVTRT